MIETDKHVRRIVFFGAYDEGIGRNNIVMEALRSADIEVVECRAQLWPDTQAKIDALRRPAGHLQTLWRLLLAWRHLLTQYRQLPDYDVLWVGSTAHLDLPLAHLLATRSGRPLIFDPLISIGETAIDRDLIGASSWSIRVLNWIEGHLFRLPDRILVDTDHHAMNWARRFGIPLQKFTRLPASAHPIFRKLAQEIDDGSVEPRTSSKAPKQEAFRVVYFGQYIPLHGVDIIIRAAEILRDHPHIRFDMVGRGQTLAQARRLAQERGLSNLFFHAKWMTPEDLYARFIKAADLCLGIFGTRGKTDLVVPYKLYTALACGRPVLSADTPAIREFFEAGEEVSLVPPGDPEALAQRILQLSQSPAKRLALAQAGQACWDKQFSSAALAEQLIEILQDLELPKVESPDLKMQGAFFGPRHRWRIRRLVDLLFEDGREAIRQAFGPDQARKQLDGQSEFQSSPSTESSEIPAVITMGGRSHANADVEADVEVDVDVDRTLLLDAGCGRASASIEYASRLSQFEPSPSTSRLAVLACDMDRQALVDGRIRADEAGHKDRIGFFQADLRALPLRENDLGTALCGEVLEHIEADGKALAEVHRVLEPGGWMAVSVPAGPERFSALDREADHKRRYSKTALEALIIESGFESHRIAGWGWPFGRLYDRWIMRPAHGMKESVLKRPLKRMGQAKLMHRLWETLFDLCTRFEQGEKSSGWMAIAQKKELKEPSD